MRLTSSKDEEGYYELALEPEENTSWQHILDIVAGKIEKRDIMKIKIQWIGAGLSMADSIENGGFAKFKVFIAQEPGNSGH
jgi:hypothetical protein